MFKLGAHQCRIFMGFPRQPQEHDLLGDLKFIVCAVANTQKNWVLKVYSND